MLTSINAAVLAIAAVLAASVLRAAPATESVDPPAPMDAESTVRPEQGEVQQPGGPATRESEAGKPFTEWLHLTDDWGGARLDLERAGIAVSSRLIADYSKDFSGGRSPGGTAFRDLFNLSITADADKLLGLHNGTIFANFQNQSGDNGSRDVGDLQMFDNIDADGRTQLSEIWYEQALLGAKLQLRIGRIDPNAFFDSAANGSDFLNSSSGISPTVLLPHYPDPSFGAQFLFTPNDWFYIGGGAFDGAFAEGVRTGSAPPSRLFERPHDIALLMEGGPRWGGEPGGLAGRLGLGVWHNSADFTAFSGATLHGSTGFYALVDQLLWRANPKDPDDARGIAMFLQYGYADPRAFAITEHFGGGVTWTGLLPGRENDVIGAGISLVRLARGAPGLDDNNEVDYEFFYKLRVTPFFSVKPDLQYVHNPGAMSATRGDAFVGTIRFMVEF